jgi:hypothetical protein
MSIITDLYLILLVFALAACCIALAARIWYARWEHERTLRSDVDEWAARQEQQRGWTPDDWPPGGV